MGVLGSLACAVGKAIFDREELVLENLALRQQLAMLKREHPRPRATVLDRAFWVALSRTWCNWANALVVVQPATVVRWHREAFRRFWTWISRPRGERGQPRVAADVREAIRRLAEENPSWGAPRIHGELVKLGFDVSERTVARYMPKRPPDPDKIRRWMAFLRNHKDGIAAMDFLVVPTVTFRLLYCLVFIEHGRRRVLHFNVTEHPTAAWVVQQIREAFPYDTAPKHLIFDRDSTFCERVVASIKGMGIEPCRTAFQTPWQNPICERFNGTLRRDLLDHVVVFGQDHLRKLVREFLGYYHGSRTHLGLDKDCPEPRAITPRQSPDAVLHSVPQVGGLHHRYEWRMRA